MRVPEKERGAALLAVLLLVAVTGALAAAGMEKLRLSTALAVNGAALDQARAYALGIEQLAVLAIGDAQAASPDKTTPAGGWMDAPRRYPFPDGSVATARIRDGGNCFNLNSVAMGDDPAELSARPAGIAQFAELLRLIEVPEREAERIAESAGDWVDADDRPNRLGAEDGVYGARARPYRAANTLFADVSELRAVAGVTPEIFARARPFLCALPVAELSPINVNTLTPDQAPLLAMLAPRRLGVDGARRIIAARPQAGWDDVGAFWRVGGRMAADLPSDILGQVKVATSWFALETRVETEGAELVQTALIDARYRPARVAARRWGAAE
ncbi:MAG: type II secretion system minor pseudopilin GspK [Allosphingosinicella sp.]|uniref:type II secretion system minor pseudopilin GspK n=1 Tax=Allosphingosinicella sp. TaxID=2823234 RepID=UPI0039242281